MASTEQRIPSRERRPSMGAPIVDIVGSVGPAGISRPKHKRTFTGFGAQEIKSVEGRFAPTPHTGLAFSVHTVLCKIRALHVLFQPTECNLSIV
jgi:hypothetical protein